MINLELEASLLTVFLSARQKRHEFVTLEHLLLGLLDDTSATEVLSACSASIDDLRQSLTKFIDGNTPQVAGTDPHELQTTRGLNRVVQRALMYARKFGELDGKNPEVTGALMLAAIFGEQDSHAVYYLRAQGVTRDDATNFIVFGTKKEKTAG